MPLRTFFCLPVCLVALLLLVAAPARADDETPPPKKAAEEKPAAPKPPAKGKDAADPRKNPDLRRDIEELVRRGGRLPEGFRPGRMGPGGMGSRGVPGRAPGGMGFGPLMGGDAAQGAMMKAMGKILLKYLDAKDDPVKGPIYEELLRDIATPLAKGEGGNLQQMGPRLMGRFMNGMRDPKKAVVYREIMQILGEAMTSAVRAPKAPDAVREGPPAPPMGPASGATARRAPLPPGTRTWPATLGGAEIIYAANADTPDQISAHLRRVPADSPAHAAGLRPGDTLLQVNGKKADPAALRLANDAFVPGGKLRLRLRRMNGTLEVLDLEFEAADDADAKADAPVDAGGDTGR